jgi:fucose permease
MHASWGFGATAGPAGATLLLALGFSWQAGFAAAGAVLATLALVFAATRRRWDAGEVTGHRVTALSVLRLPTARLQIAIYFVYCGVEFGTGQWAATVLAARGATPAEAGAAAALFWAGLAFGRVAMGFLVDRVGAARLVRLAVGVALLASIGFALLPGAWAFAALALVSAGLSPVYPTLMALTPARLGAAAAVHAIGFQVAAATLGVAVLPGLLGLAADAFGAEVVPGLLAGLALLLVLLIRRLPPPRGEASPPARDGKAKM